MEPSSSTTNEAIIEKLKPLVSVVIVNFNAGRWLERCLQALASQTYDHFEAIIVDNGSTDGSIESLALPDERFKVHEAGRNLGFAAANNIGARLAKGDWLAVLNPDAFPEPDWLHELLAATRRHPDACMFGSSQVLHARPDLLDGAGDCLSWFGFAWRGGFGHPVGQTPPEGEVFSPCAAAAMYRMDIFRQAGGFCEKLFCYNEDVDLGFRLRLMGHRAIQAPKAVVRHVSSGISGREGDFSTYHGHRNAIWVHIVNMPWPLAAISIPAHLFAETALLAIKFLQAMIGRGDPARLVVFRAMARGFGHGICQSPWAWRARGNIQAKRVVSLGTVAKALSWSPLPFMKRAPLVKPAPGTAPEPHPKSYLAGVAAKTMSWARVAKRTVQLFANGRQGEALRLFRIWCTGIPRIFQPGSAVYFRPRQKSVLASSTPQAKILGNRTIPCFMVGRNLNLEGAPRSQLDLTLALRDLGVINPVVFSPQDGPLRGEYEAAGVPVVVEPGLGRNPRTENEYMAGLAKLKGIIKQTGCEMVYANTALSYFAVDAARQMALPCLWNIRESEDWRTYFDFLPATVAQTALSCFSHPQFVVFVSHASARVWDPLRQKPNFRVIHTGLDSSEIENRLQGPPREEARAALGLPDNQVALLFVGVVARHKGQCDLPRALAGLGPEALSQVRCFIVGDRQGPYSKRLHKLTAKLGGRLENRLSILPETPDIALFYRAADIFVCTSRVDTYPRVILEAMACGLPIVTTPAYGIREQVTPGVNCLFYTPGRPMELARAIECLVNAPGLRSRMGRAQAGALKALPSFGQMTQAYAELFEQAARG